MMRIDFVSDIACPWCFIGLKGLTTAIESLRGELDVEIHCQPFELNPDMPPGGRLMAEHLAEKFGSAEGFRERTAAVRARAAEVGAEIRLGDDARIWNTFDAHRLLHWAAGPKQVELKLALFRTYFTEGRDVGDRALLAALAGEVGLDAAEARRMLDEGRFSEEVRRDEQLWRQRGINGVPAAIVDGRYLISGGQPAHAYESALRQIAATQVA